MYYYGDPYIRSIVGDQCNSLPLSRMSEGENKKAVAYCDSTSCLLNFKSKSKVLKMVEKTTTYCPDCRNALVWKIETNYND